MPKKGTTYHKPYKGKKGVPVKKATGKNIKSERRVGGNIPTQNALRTAKRYTTGKKRRS